MADTPPVTLEKLKAALREERVGNSGVAERHLRFVARVTACGEGTDYPPTVSEFLIWRHDHLFKGVRPGLGSTR